MPHHRSTWLLLAILLGWAPTAAAQPETRGPLAVADWDVGDVSAAGVSIPLLVYHPEAAAGPAPTVIVMHGASRSGAYHEELARTLASRGFVTLVPDMPCGFTGCDHDANAEQLAALLDWVLAQSADASSRLSGQVDEGRLGLVGHSWGGLAVHLAAARDDRVRAVVTLDPNDDRGIAVTAAPDVTAPNAHLMAAVPGACNGSWGSTVYPETGAPKLRLTVARSGHCSPEEPTDALCPLACGVGDGSTTPYFRRYAVAWLACFLAGDESMAGWIGGSSFDDDVSDGTVEDEASQGLGSVTCRRAAERDAGVPSGDAGAGLDAGGGPLDAGGSARDAGSLDSGTVAGADGGGGGSADDDGGCGCSTPGGRGGSPLAWLVLIAIAGLAGRVAIRSRRAG